MLHIFLNCEVKATWCGNFTILLPLKFYVKSNFGELKQLKLGFLAILERLNFDFGKFVKFFIGQNHFENYGA